MGGFSPQKRAKPPTSRLRRRMNHPHRPSCGNVTRGSVAVDGLLGAHIAPLAVASLLEAEEDLLVHLVLVVGVVVVVVVRLVGVVREPAVGLRLVAARR